MTFTTSYKSNGMLDLLTNLVRLTDPDLIVELGVQQGSSAIALAQGLTHGHLYGYDLFLDKYQNPPYGETHASMDEANDNISMSGLNKKITIAVANAFEVYKLYDKVDILHVDICNHFDNIVPILENWHDKVTKMILLEGGDENHWQKKYGFEPFTPALNMSYMVNQWNYVVIRGQKDYALTILTRRKP